MGMNIVDKRFNKLKREAKSQNDRCWSGRGGGCRRCWAKSRSSSSSSNSSMYMVFVALYV